MTPRERIVATIVWQFVTLGLFVVNYAVIRWSFGVSEVWAVGAAAVMALATPPVKAGSEGQA